MCVILQNAPSLLHQRHTPRNAKFLTITKIVSVYFWLRPNSNWRSVSRLGISCQSVEVLEGKPSETISELLQLTCVLFCYSCVSVCTCFSCAVVGFSFLIKSSKQTILIFIVWSPFQFRRLFLSKVTSTYDQWKTYFKALSTLLNPAYIAIKHDAGRHSQARVCWFTHLNRKVFKLLDNLVLDPALSTYVLNLFNRLIIVRWSVYIRDVIWYQTFIIIS